MSCCIFERVPMTTGWWCRTHDRDAENCGPPEYQPDEDRDSLLPYFGAEDDWADAS